VPSVGNLIPEVCRSLCACAERGDWAEAQRHADRMNEVAALYQRGRSLGESLAVLKGALSIRGMCESNVLAPVRPLASLELETLRQQMARLELLNGAGTEAVRSRSKEATASVSRTLASEGGPG